MHTHKRMDLSTEPVTIRLSLYLLQSQVNISLPSWPWIVKAEDGSGERDQNSVV